MAFIVASLCTLVLLLSEVYDERDHVNEDFAHYLRVVAGMVLSSGRSPGIKASFSTGWQLMMAQYFAFFWSSPWQ